MNAIKTLLCMALLLAAARPAAAQAAGAGETEFNAGLQHLRDSRPEQALVAFKKAVKEDSKNPYFYKGLGQAYLGLGKFGDAVTALRKALEINPYYVDARNDLGTALVLAGKVDEGKRELSSALNDPMNPAPEVTARNLGQAYFDEKNYAEAASWFRTSIRRNKAYGEAYVRLADSLVLLGQLDEAILHLEAAAKELPDSLQVTLALGEAYYQAGRFSEARQRLEAVAGKDPVSRPGRRAAALLKGFPK